MIKPAGLSFKKKITAGNRINPTLDIHQLSLLKFTAANMYCIQT